MTKFLKLNVVEDGAGFIAKSYEMVDGFPMGAEIIKGGIGGADIIVSINTLEPTDKCLEVANVAEISKSEMVLEIEMDLDAEEREIEEALDFYREFLG